jgi:hypothetical protein
MADNTDETDKRLVHAWDDFCDQLKAAKAVVFRDTAPAAPRDRAAGLRMLARNIALALDVKLENADPQRPELTHNFNWRRKQGGDNPDALYLAAPVDGRETYRVTGTRGSAPFVAFTVAARGGSPWGGPAAGAGAILGPALAVDDDGRFEVMLGPEPPEPMPANWIKTTPDTFRLTVRQFFSDWESEEPMRLRIDRLGDPLPPPVFDADALVSGLAEAGRFLRETTGYWADTIETWQARPLEFLSLRQVLRNGPNATPGGEPLLCYWEMAADEALILRVTPPPARYWNIELGNWWFESMDYRYRPSSTNAAHATLEDDGDLIVVVAHDDPGLANWLDASGHAAGYLACRWMGAETAPAPRVTRVPRAALFAHLPATVKMTEPAARQARQAARRHGVMRRFSGY